MAKKFLIINIGSSSKRYSLSVDGVQKTAAHFSKNEVSFSLKLNQEEKMEISANDFLSSTNYFIKEIISRGLILNQEEITGVGLRIVAPGSYFTENKLIDIEYLEKLNEIKNIAPLHTVPMVEEIERLKDLLPEIPLVGISDSTFHAGMPEVSRLYSIPKTQSEEFDIYRFGYHGISVQSVLAKLNKLTKSKPSRVIVCHLGSGSSITAVKDGLSMDTSMGFTPVSGLTMATRSGNIGFGAAFYLAKKLNLDLSSLEKYLNTKCGLLGLSEKTGDIKTLLQLEERGDKKAKQALEVFVYHVRKYIGAYSVVLGGLDAIVFTASAGVGSAELRSRICQNLDYLGVNFDEGKNMPEVNEDRLITTPDSKVSVFVVRNDEIGEISESMTKILE